MRTRQNAVGNPMTVPERNQQLAALFRSIAELLAAQRANPYRIRAYRRGADALLALDEDVAVVAQRNALEAIDGIGTDLSRKIEEFLSTGTIATLETLRVSLPDQVKGWAQLPGLSESLVAYLYSRLNIRTLADLETLVRSHMLRTMPGYSGSEETLLHAIEELRRRCS
jgi:DNA polymerase (family 10)